MKALQRKIQRYALELLIVFLGVSLSLLAENWRQNRVDDRSQYDSLARLHTDMLLEQGDMRGNVLTAERGLRSARWLAENTEGQHAADSVSTALTNVGSCSFFVPYSTEYTALKSSGRLSLLRDDDLRNNIVRLYEQEEFLAWLHERDCTLTGDLVDWLIGKVDFSEPTTRRSTRYPRIIFQPGDEALLRDPGFRGRLMRIATQRQYMVDQINSRIQTTERLRASIDSVLLSLGADSADLRQNGRGFGPGGFPAGGSRDTTSNGQGRRNGRAPATTTN